MGKSRTILVQMMQYMGAYAWKEKGLDRVSLKKMHANNDRRTMGP
jgi:hypothetical protein